MDDVGGIGVCGGGGEVVFFAFVCSGGYENTVVVYGWFVFRIAVSGV